MEWYHKARQQTEKNNDEMVDFFVFIWKLSAIFYWLLDVFGQTTALGMKHAKCECLALTPSRELRLIEGKIEQ